MRSQEPTSATDDLVLEVTSDFSLHSRSFVYKGKQFSYGGISSLIYIGTLAEINLVNVGSSASLFITHDDLPRDIAIDSTSYVFRTKKLKNIGKAAQLLFQATFQSRLNRYLERLKRDGRLVYPDYKKEITIFANGDITDGNHKFNLVTAREKKYLEIGYDSRLIYEGRTDPYQVTVSESGFALWDSKIKFSINRDYDVMITLLKALSGERK